MREVWITAALRTAVGDFGGGLKDVAPIDLGATVVKAVLEKGGAVGEQVGHLAFGHVVPTEARDMYLSRVVALSAGLPDTTAAFNVNRLCGSGLQAIVSASQSILLGDTEMAVGGGAENMSRGGYLSEAMRSGARMGDTKVTDMMVGALTDPFGRMHMGVTAENVAKQFEISREDQDSLALESHRRAVQAWDEGRFKDQIVPVVIKSRKGETVFDTDESGQAQGRFHQRKRHGDSRQCFRYQRWRCRRHAHER
jgi:acetyl-CoA C-acetyltransferase